MPSERQESPKSNSSMEMTGGTSSRGNSGGSAGRPDVSSSRKGAASPPLPRARRRPTIDQGRSQSLPRGVGRTSSGSSSLGPHRNSVSTLSLSSARTPSQNGVARSWNVTSSTLNLRPELELVFRRPLEKQYECPVCCRVLRYPVQFEECGHRCCSACLPELLRVAPRCPIDQTRVDRDKVYVDKQFQKELDDLEVKCSNCDRGCPWDGSLRQLVIHIEACDYTPVPCPSGCGAEFERRFLEKHVQDDCARRDVTCEFCATAVRLDQEEDHLQTCKLFPIPCPNGCKEKEIPRERLNHHVQKECPKENIPCPFVEAGCNFRSERSGMDVHLRNDPEKHLNLISATLATYKRTLEIQTRSIDQQVDRMAAIETKVDSLEKQSGPQLVWKISDYQDRFSECESGRKPIIFSPTFYTNQHGYKLSLSTCLYGDGKARGRYMSLFVNILKGEFDSVLKWPFGNKITLTLLDQCQDPAARHNITYTVKPNTVKENLAFLGRPVGEKNASFGAQKFVDLEVLKTMDYIRDDAMFIKVSVDLENMSML